MHNESMGIGMMASAPASVSGGGQWIVDMTPAPAPGISPDSVVAAAPSRAELRVTVIL